MEFFPPLCFSATSFKSIKKTERKMNKDQSIRKYKLLNTLSYFIRIGNLKKHVFHEKFWNYYWNYQVKTIYLPFVRFCEATITIPFVWIYFCFMSLFIKWMEDFFSGPTSLWWVVIKYALFQQISQTILFIYTFFV